ncbi:DUF4442 domain-containing protein [Flavobacteriaceae bacterium]|nr:DUF4442 domain-containing protein [Flavobacteriaceae bacterium]
MQKFTLFIKNQMSFFWLPSAWICGVRVDWLESNKCSVRVKLGFFNKNPFKSLFWAVQGMAAEMPGGLLLQNKIKNSGQNIAMLLVGSSSKFTKKAVGKILFTFENGDELVNQAVKTKEAQTITIRTSGVDENGDVVSEFSFNWSIKLRSKR